MHIYTAAFGWRPLLVKLTTTLQEAPPRYRGELPSSECNAYNAALEAGHQEWLNRKAAMEALNTAEAA